MSFLTDKLGLKVPRLDIPVSSSILEMGQELANDVGDILPESNVLLTYEAYPDNFKIKFWVGDTIVGYFNASRVMIGGMHWDQSVPAHCKSAWYELHQPPFWSVRFAEWNDGRLIGKNLGFRAYQIIFSYISERGGAVSPDFCSGGCTSPEAMRVWKRLRQIYPSKGPFIDLRTASSPPDKAHTIEWSI